MRDIADIRFAIALCARGVQPLRGWLRHTRHRRPMPCGADC